MTAIALITAMIVVFFMVPLPMSLCIMCLGMRRPETRRVSRLDSMAEVWSADEEQKVSS
jgi:hypothetical protein